MSKFKSYFLLKPRFLTTTPSSISTIPPPSIIPTDNIFTSLNTEITSSIINTPLSAITSIGDLKTLGLCSNYPTGLIQQLIEFTHVTSHLPWSASIITATILVRLLLIPIHIKSLKVSAKMAAIKPLSEPIQEEIKRLRKVGDIMGSKIQTQKLMALFKEHKLNPLSALIGVVQIPVFISFFLGLQSMAHANVPGFTTQGLLWITDLTLPDPTFILPTLSSLGLIVAMKVGELGAPSAMTPTMKSAFTFMGFAGIFFMAYLPSAVFMYTIPSLIFTLGQTLVFQSPIVRKKIGLPIMPPVVVGAKAFSTIAVKPLTFKESFKAFRQANASLKNN